MPISPSPRSRARLLGVAALVVASSFAVGCSSESATLTNVTLPPTTVKASAQGAGASPNFPTTADPAGGGPAPKQNVPASEIPPNTPTPKAVAAKRTPEEMAASCAALHDYQWAMLFIDIAVTGGKLRDKLESELNRTAQAFTAVDKNWTQQIETIRVDLLQRLETHLAAIADLPKGENKASEQPPNSPEVARARAELNFFRSVCPPVA